VVSLIFDSTLWRRKDLGIIMGILRKILAETAATSSARGSLPLHPRLDADVC